MAGLSVRVVAVAAARAVQLIGMPEVRINVAQAVVAIATAPKSPAVIPASRGTGRPASGDPSRHHPVERWVKPDEFVELGKEAEAIGFVGVLSGPLVRSSYRAGRLYRQAIEARAAA